MNSQKDLKCVGTSINFYSTPTHVTAPQLQFYWIKLQENSGEDVYTEIMILLMIKIPFN